MRFIVMFVTAVCVLYFLLDVFGNEPVVFFVS